MFALVDCNNFYCSCERVFRPELEGKPVIVLSNNDGCAIARSEEAKALGIVMGTPAFAIKEIIEKDSVNVFSSNYVLYWDMAMRVNEILKMFAPKVEVYSVDEAFLDFSGLKKHLDAETIAKNIKRTVTKWTGIPVSVGIAPSKTLAKLANKFAKKQNRAVGVHSLETKEEIIKILQETDIKDVWGIGKANKEKLNAAGVRTAFDITEKSDDWIRREMSVQGLRLKYELTGISCRPLENQRTVKENITCSRSFGVLQTDKKIIGEAVANFAAHAAMKLRRQKCCTGGITIFLHTHPFIKSERTHNPSIHIPFLTATASTSEIVGIARKVAEAMAWKGYRYLKGGVILHNIVPEEAVQQSLFDQPGKRAAEERLSVVMDNVNAAMGRNTIALGSMGNSKEWHMKRAHLSPAYTTDYTQLRLVS